MKTINRAVAIVAPKQPYIDWANSFDDGGPTLNLEEAMLSPHAYLIDQFDYSGFFMQFVEKHYRKIFEEELWSWMTDQKSWPKKRTLKMFKEWFEIEICEMVYDLSKNCIEVEDD